MAAAHLRRDLAVGDLLRVQQHHGGRHQRVGGPLPRALPLGRAQPRREVVQEKQPRDSEVGGTGAVLARQRRSRVHQAARLGDQGLQLVAVVIAALARRRRPRRFRRARLLGGGPHPLDGVADRHLGILVPHHLQLACATASQAQLSFSPSCDNTQAMPRACRPRRSHTARKLKVHDTITQGGNAVNCPIGDVLKHIVPHLMVAPRSRTVLMKYRSVLF